MNKLEVKIYYEDTDCGGVIYHANYLRYFERARTEFFAERGVSIRDLMEEGIIFVVARAEVNFESPGRYGDVLVVESKIEQAKKVSFLFNHVVRRKGEDTVLEVVFKRRCRLYPHLPHNVSNRCPFHV